MAGWRHSVLTIASVTAALCSPLVAQAPDVSTRAIVARAAAYVREYQQQLTSVLADEIYTQDVVEQIPRDQKASRTRTLRSEVFFMFAPARRVWMAIRDVIAIDDKAVENRRDIVDALRTLPPHEVAAVFKQYNSRFNIGRIFRNFNEPTLSLLVLDDEHRKRFSFDRKQISKTEPLLVTIEFKERDTPTLIFDLRRGGRVFSKGELVVEAETGRIRRAVLTANVNEWRVQLTTTYRPDERLGMWVPAEFEEHYAFGVSNSRSLDSSVEYEEIRCQAKYSNYRRFQTTVRIK